MITLLDFLKENFELKDFSDSSILEFKCFFDIIKSNLKNITSDSDLIFKINKINGLNFVTFNFDPNYEDLGLNKKYFPIDIKLPIVIHLGIEYKLSFCKPASNSYYWLTMDVI